MAKHNAYLLDNDCLPEIVVDLPMSILHILAILTMNLGSFG